VADGIAFPNGMAVTRDNSTSWSGQRSSELALSFTAGRPAFVSRTVPDEHLFVAATGDHGTAERGEIFASVLECESQPYHAMLIAMPAGWNMPFL
jgi:hypothetical protein